MLAAAGMWCGGVRMRPSAGPALCVRAAARMLRLARGLGCPSQAPRTSTCAAAGGCPSQVRPLPRPLTSRTAPQRHATALPHNCDPRARQLGPARRERLPTPPRHLPAARPDGAARAAGVRPASAGRAASSSGAGAAVARTRGAAEERRSRGRARHAADAGEEWGSAITAHAPAAPAPLPRPGSRPAPREVPPHAAAPPPTRAWPAMPAVTAPPPRGTSLPTRQVPPPPQRGRTRPPARPGPTPPAPAADLRHPAPARKALARGGAQRGHPARPV
jgi:hypothetical protein